MFIQVSRILTVPGKRKDNGPLWGAEAFEPTTHVTRVECYALSRIASFRPHLPMIVDSELTKTVHIETVDGVSFLSTGDYDKGVELLRSNAYLIEPEDDLPEVPPIADLADVAHSDFVNHLVKRFREAKAENPNDTTFDGLMVHMFGGKPY